MLLEKFALPASSNRDYLPGFRAYLKDSLVFETPGLDTTQFKLTPKPLYGRRIEYYAPKRSMLKIVQRGESLRSWWAIYLPLILIVPIYRWYRTVRKLTEPSA